MLSVPVIAMWRVMRHGALRATVVVALVGGMLGAVVLAAFAGAERTDTAYGRYLRSIAASDVLVNIATPQTALIGKVDALPQVQSRAEYVGFAANPVVNGRVDDAFLTNNLEGSVDGEYFRQDRMSVVRGRLPRLDSTDEIALTAGMARVFGVGVGGQVRWAFLSSASDSRAASIAAFRVTGIVAVPPALVDQFDDVPTAVLPPAATAQHLDSTAYSWVALRLHGGAAAIPQLRSELATISASHGGDARDLRILDTVHAQAQQAIRPQAIALAVFGVAVGLALLILVGLGLNGLVRRSTAHLPVLRSVGATRAQAAGAACVQGVFAVTAATVLAVGGAFAMSPVAPVGAVRHVDPSSGIRFDATVLLPGAAILFVVLLGMLATSAWRGTSPSYADRSQRPSRLVAAMSAAGFSISSVTGARYALQRDGDRAAAPVRSTIFGSAVAVLAVVSTVVFGASLAGLLSHPVRYGWNWDLLVESEGGYGNWTPAEMAKLVNANDGVTGWSTFGFTQVPVDGIVVPALGITRQTGSVQPPTTSGESLSAPDQIELGARTLSQLGKHVGDQVRVGVGPQARELTIVGTVTLPSIGLITADHVSLGRGAMLPEDTLLSSLGLEKFRDRCGPGCSSAVAIDLAPGVAATPVAASIAAANPDGVPGGTYQVHRVVGASIVNAQDMASQPRTLALTFAGAAILSLMLTVLSSVRRRERELAVLKALGMRRRQLRATVAWHATITLVIAIVVGLPLGVAAGRLAWREFADSLGVVPSPSVPTLTIVLGALALLAIGNLVALVPATVAARTSVASTLRSE